LDCKDAEELLPAYALNALGPDETTLVSAHLDSCPWCSVIFRSQAQVASSLAQALERHELPEGLKGRIIRSARAQTNQRRASERMFFAPNSLLLGAAASIAIAVLTAVITIGVLTLGEVDDVKQNNSDLAAQVSVLADEDTKIMDAMVEQRTVSYIMASPNRQVVSLEGTSGAQGVLMMAAPDSSNVLLMTTGLAQLSGDWVYYVWLKDGGDPVAVGHFSVDESGWGMFSVWLDDGMGVFHEVWVTAERGQNTFVSGADPIIEGTISTR
jgi:hypothetical protein